MILRKTMSLLGVGSAKVDLVLDRDNYRAGEEVKGYLVLKGGTIEQKMKRIDCDLMMRDQKRGCDIVIDSYTILTSSLISSNEVNKQSFRFLIPDNAPESTKDMKYFFQTKLIFTEGIESKDIDEIQIVS